MKKANKLQFAIQNYITTSWPWLVKYQLSLALCSHQQS